MDFSIIFKENYQLDELRRMYEEGDKEEIPVTDVD
jgi:hypothetical protein